MVGNSSSRKSAPSDNQAHLKNSGSPPRSVRTNYRFVLAKPLTVEVAARISEGHAKALLLLKKESKGDSGGSS